jgi:DNA-binding transcriptional MerR regulator
MAGAQRKKDNQKAPPKLYRIGEVIKYTSFSRQTIHNFTVMGLIHEVEWTEGGHRLYDESIFSTLSKIAQFKKAGKTLKEIKQLLHSSGK